MDYTTIILRAALGTILAWLPVSPEILSDLSGYLCPIYTGAAFAGIFYFKREIGIMPQGLTTQRVEEWPRIFLYSILFTFVVGYPLGRRVGVLSPLHLILADVALGLGLLILGVLNRPLLNLPEDIRAFVLSTLVGASQGLSSPGVSRGSSSLFSALLIEKNVERAVKTSLLASPGYFALRALLLGEPSMGSEEVLVVATVSFLLSLAILKVLLKSARYGKKFVIIYALISLAALIWR